MKLKYYVIGLWFFLTFSIWAQEVDTNYIGSYKEKIMVMGFVSRNFIQIENNYSPNTPLNVGMGISIKNTFIDFKFQIPTIYFNEEKQGKTENTDVQIHNYGRHFLFDVSYQRYKGYYSEKEAIPDLTLQQIGFRTVYVFNGNKFSAKAAFEQNEKQLISAGSFILGLELNHYKIDYNLAPLNSTQINFNNLILGLNVGYGYSWVINNNWLLTSISTVGINFGNELEMLKDGKIKIYPSAFSKQAIGYHEANWGINFSMLINTKIVYSPNKNINLNAVNMQLSYITHFDSFF